MYSNRVNTSSLLGKHYASVLYINNVFTTQAQIKCYNTNAVQTVAHVFQCKATGQRLTNYFFIVRQQE